MKNHRERIIDVSFGTLPRRGARAARSVRRAPCRRLAAPACVGVLYANARRKS